MTDRRRQLLKPVALAVLLAVGLAACGRDNRDDQELRGFLGAAEKQTRAFELTEAAVDRWYRVQAQIQDDLRYRMTLSAPDGPVVELVVVDDALAVRLPRPEAVAELDLPLGHPTTVDALMTGRWVVDPAAAPPLAPPPAQGDELQEAPDPIEVATRLLRLVRAQMGQAGEVREFSLEDIQYRPSLDPWEHPDREAGEVRYDMLRPILPIREEQVQQGNITIGESHFRKTSVFVKDDELYQICETVDVEGHEEFVKLREENIDNEFLESVREQVLEGRTVTPVRPRNTFMSFSYPEEVVIELPEEALEARLGVFLEGLAQGLKEGLIEPPGPLPSDCLRTEDTAGATASG